MVFWAYMAIPKAMEAGTAPIPCKVRGTLLVTRRKHSAQAVPLPVLNGTQTVPVVGKYKCMHKQN